MKDNERHPVGVKADQAQHLASALRAIRNACSTNALRSWERTALQAAADADAALQEWEDSQSSSEVKP